MKRFFVLSALASASFASHAYYVTLTPPPAVSAAQGMTTVAINNAAASSAFRTSLAGGHVMAQATLNAGARQIAVPVAFRVAGNAAAFAVTRMNPYVAGATLAAAAIPYVSDWLSGSPTPLEVSPEGRLRVPAKSGGTLGGYQLPDGRTVDAAISSDFSNFACPCTAGIAYRDPGCGGGVNANFAISILDRYGTGIGAICTGPTQPTAPPPTPARYVEPGDLVPLEQTPINPALFPYIESPVPVDPLPVVNPATQPIGDVVISPTGNPAPAVSPAPLRVPDGEPVPIPNTSPQEYTQPWIEVVPAPTAEDPWRVDVRPVTTTTTSPTSPTGPVTVPDTNTDNPSPTTGQTDCDKYPGSLGCIPVGDIPDDEIPTDEREIELQDGPSFGGGSCPADLVLTIHGQTITALDMGPACGWISNLMRPLILLLAAISAVFIVAPKPEN